MIEPILMVVLLVPVRMNLFETDSFILFGDSGVLSVSDSDKRFRETERGGRI